MTKKNKTKTVKITCEFTVPFRSYGSEQKDKWAAAQIKRWIKFGCRNGGNGFMAYIPLYIEKDGRAPIEDSCQRTRVKFK